jgi:DNA-binding GntR family transcriptional regulator
VQRRHENDVNDPRVYTALKAMLVDHRFRPGEQLLIGELAKHLQVSATPVRETLVRLQAERLLDVRPRRGFFARILTQAEMSELYDLRLALLRHALEGDFRPATAAARAMAALNELQPPDCGASAHMLDKVPLHARFIERAYERLVSLCGHKATLDIVRNVNDRTHHVLTIDLECHQRLIDATLAVREAFVALDRGDVIAAVMALAREHCSAIARMPTLVEEAINRASTPRNAHRRTNVVNDWSRVQQAPSVDRANVQGRSGRRAWAPGNYQA